MQVIQFDEASHGRVATRVAEFLQEHSSYGLLAQSWNAVSTRTISIGLEADAFAKSLVLHGVGPKQLHRIEQERSIFGFYTSAVSSIEALHFWLYILGSVVRPEHFNLPEKGVTRTRTMKALEATFPREPITLLTREIEDDLQFEEICSTRHILSHRLIFPRQFFVGGEEDGSATWNGRPLVRDMLEQPRDLVVGYVNAFIRASTQFVDLLLSERSNVKMHTSALRGD